MDNPDKEKAPPPKDAQESANWSHDIEDRGYYYDDSTGYEVYDPEADKDAGEDEAEEPGIEGTD